MLAVENTCKRTSPAYDLGQILPEASAQPCVRFVLPVSETGPSPHGQLRSSEVLAQMASLEKAGRSAR